MQFTPYLSFQGQCAEAMAFYGEVFGAKPELLSFSSMPDAPDMPGLPDEQKNWIMHGEIRLPDGAALMGADMPPQYGGQKQAGVSVAVSFATAEKAQAIFDQLARGGETTMPFTATFFSPGFGMTKDRFGTSWMVMTAEAAAKG
ncbi:VOC family protein [Paracoccus aminophilus]|uniref:3-demethylubiquinone-9 3-methyltransferase n=1 Tax=Paracoccus aminophilus JCM 7686 TaxID=1367847 RepID=S5XV40_PARAH|nr:VOC family protein [Paracoccus aminophilus]AGT09077.1 3-demethylubiquinone-9 3-methyltransferase [Paracoccus aminophilus JCM 7686]